MRSLSPCLTNMYPSWKTAWRKDLIDLYNSGKEAKLKNTMNGFYHLEEADGRLPVVAGDGAQHGRDEALAAGQRYRMSFSMITTVYGPVPDSQVEFLHDRLEAVGLC